LSALSGGAAADRRQRELCATVDRDRTRTGHPCRPIAGAGGCLSAAYERVLHLRWPVDLALTVASHGWVHLAPWHWNGDAGRLARIEKIEGRLGTVEVTQRDTLAVHVGWTGFDDVAEIEVLRRVQRWLSADWEPSEAIGALTDLAGLIER